MTSEIEVLKTNEILRRRKLRLQQVREQSKDIAKKIRQRAKVEQLKQISGLDVKKQKEYLEQQGELVRKLEDLYAKGVSNIGTSHKNAAETRFEELPEKVDFSKLRGREAAAELKRKKQEKLDEQKKLLDRKLQAREAANELSREKSTAVAKRISKKDTDDIQVQSTNNPEENLKKTTENVEANKAKLLTNDMATQWDFDGLPNEWEPNIPALSLPKDDSLKETNNNIESISDRRKRLDLFALSEEMPTSLRGSLTQVENRVPVKSSMTLVTEYLQSRGMRLRETGTTSKRQTEDLQNIKQTILRARSSKPEGSPINACHVLDEQIIPMPSWRAEKCCEFCSHSVSHHTDRAQLNVTNSELTKNFSTKRPTLKGSLLPSPVLHGTSPFKRNKVFSAISNREKSAKSNVVDSGVTKKSSVMIYNHSTRDRRDVPICDDRLVVRDDQTEEDAYSQAMKESTADKDKDREHQKKIQDMRNKVAMTKQSIEKEYKDTINFLNSLPKDTNSRPIHKAYKNENRQQVQRENHQRKMEQKYKQIEKECKKHSCTKNRTKSKSPVKDVENNLDRRDFQYSWMPVPESDGNLAVHTIPTTLKQGKPNNTVKFSRVDSYHEYRSRHKHTPPTRDTIGREADRKVEAVIIDNDSANSTEYSSVSSDTSSVENIRLKERDPKSTVRESSDAERIIIYKILDSKNKRKCKKKAQSLKDVTKSPISINKTQISTDGQNMRDNKNGDESENIVSLEQLPEGVFKTVNEKGDNITSMYFPNDQRNYEKNILRPDEIKNGRPCCCNKGMSKDQQQNQGTNLRWETGDQTTRVSNTCVGCKCGCTGHSKPNESVKPSVVQPSAATSTTSFKTTNNDKASNALPDCGYVKLLDDGGQEAGKFYIGASGFLKDDAYEVIIQLRKKEDKLDNRDLVDKPNYKEKDKSNNVTQPVSVEATEALNDPSVKSIDEIKACNNIVNQIKVGSNASVKSDSVVSSPRESCIDSDNISLQPIISENANTIQAHKTKSADKDTSPSKDLANNGVHTSFQASYAVPKHAPKTDPPPKMATSTYTQTSTNSPNHRPVYFHMSSSTSTAYMSPPEYVLPKYLKQDYRTVDEELFVPTEDFTVEDEIETSDQQQYIEESDKCKCKRCIHARNIVLTKTKAPFCCKKRSKLRLSKLDTPPNTAKTCSTEHGINVLHHKSGYESRDCYKFISQPGSVASKKSYNENNKHTMKIKNKISQHCKTDNHIASTSKYKQSNGSKIASKPNLNPAIKEYVNKLLSLNREGVKVVEIADQECSSIATPSSSIINDSKNIDKDKPVQSNMSLEQIKSMLKLQILEEYIKKKENMISCAMPHNKNQLRINLKIPRVSRRKQVHKVKSLNISKNILKTKTSTCDTKQSVNNVASSTSSSKENNIQPTTIIGGKTKFRSKSSPTPRHIDTTNVMRKSSADISKVKRFKDKINIYNTKSAIHQLKTNIPLNRNTFTFLNNRASKTSITTSSTDSENSSIISKMQESKMETSVPISTQTSQNINRDINYMKLAEDKLQNMEKIADLTEKCTKRLSNLARVLEEVRRNKTLAYSQISTSDTASDSDQKSDKNVPNIKSVKETNHLIGNTSEIPEKKSPTLIPITDKANENYTSPANTDFVPFLTDIPKPNISKTSDYNPELSNSNTNLLIPVANIDNCIGKTRAKPPPAMSRIYLKNGQEHVIPHELSTVLEVDSPISLKLKTTSSRDTKDDTGSNTSSGKVHKKPNDSERYLDENKEPFVNPDLLQSNIDAQQSKMSLTESSDDSKLQMMDLKQFNEIMLKPFITFKEHAKRCNIVINEGSNLEDNPKGTATDDISSLHSDGSLPDVIAELLKRNIITEPFKYETPSNVNSTTISSESTLSVLALSQVRKKNHSGVTFRNKESIGETSDSISVSSNPDLENAFKKLGMGWASSTLKKTKERLALSSSSNTSSTSLSQYKLKSFNNQDIPALVTDSVSTILNLSKKPGKERNITDNKNALQQTSLTNSMTVKEFLTNELANKITFTNKSHRDDTEEEFVSLFETKMPENMKDTSQVIQEECSGDTGNSANNNRARTSTPVQVFKSTTYHSSSSSNMSNGLFSNADDLSSVKVTSNSKKNHSTSDKDDLTVPNLSLKMKKSLSDCSKSE